MRNGANWNNKKWSFDARVCSLCCWGVRERFRLSKFRGKRKSDAAVPTQVFPCRKWFADDEGDGLISRILYESKSERKQVVQSTQISLLD